MRWFILAIGTLLIVATPPGLGLPISLLRQADALVAQGDYSPALTLYEKAPASADAALVQNRIGSLYLARHELDQAADHFQLALRAASSGGYRAAASLRGKALLGLGMVAAERGDYDGAIGSLEQARALYPGESEANFFLGVAYLQNFEFERAREALSLGMAVSAVPGQGQSVSGQIPAPPSRVASKDANATGGPPSPSAFKHANAMRGILSLNAGTNSRLGPAHFYLGLAYLTQDRDAADKQFALALGDGEAGDAARLLWDATEELRGVDDRPYADAVLGRALLRANQERLARWFLEQAVQARPELADAQAYLGYAYWLEGRKDDALAALAADLRLAPSRPLGHYFRGVVLRSQRRLDEAVAEFQEAIRLDGDNAEAYVELARTLTLQARYLEAGVAFARALDLQPADVEIKLIAARFYLDHVFNLGQALDLAREAVRLAPENADALDTLGWALYANARIEEAEGVLHQAIAAAPTNADAHHHLGVLLEARGDAAGAAVEYRRAADLR